LGREVKSPGIIILPEGGRLWDDLFVFKFISEFKETLMRDVKH